MIRFTCPTCKTVLQAPGEKSGEKVACPKCGQRLLVPNPVKPAASNKTVLGEPMPFPNRLGDVRAAEEKATLPAATPTPVPAPAPDVERRLAKLYAERAQLSSAFLSSQFHRAVILGVVLLVGAYVGLRILDYEIKVWQEEEKYQNEVEQKPWRKYEPRYKPVFRLFP